MNSLFATLVDAATGRGEALRPPPLPPFARTELSPSPEMTEESVGATDHAGRAAPEHRRHTTPEPPPVPTSPERPRPVAREGGKGHAESLLLPRAPDDLPPTAAAAPDRAEPTRNEPLPVDSLPTAPEPRTSAPPRTPAAVAEPTLLAPVPAHPHRTGDGPAPRDRAAPTVPDQAAPGRGTRNPPPEIRIGRIEVVPPAPVTVAKAAPPSRHRPSRAAPRESLVDYLNSRRR